MSSSWAVSSVFRKYCVFAGNGPSAISLSYLLHGHRPYFNGHAHSNSMLTEKLHDSKTSIVNQDLEFLSEGLEGRSPNPVALLWDSLVHPDADLGAENPSMLSWKHELDQAKSHVVLGKMKPGGAWQNMEGSMQTLSQNGWMELPDLPFRHWLAKRHRRLDFSSNRATTGDVRDYYEEYVEAMGLREHFKDYHTVTAVQKLFCTNSCADCESGEVEPCCQNIRQNHHFLWEVRGYKTLAPPLRSPRESGTQETRGSSIGDGTTSSDEEFGPEAADSDSGSRCSGGSADKDLGEVDVDGSALSTSRSSSLGRKSRKSSCSSSSSQDLTNTFGDLSLEREEFCFVTPNVVLATGTYDIPNRLGVIGESSTSVIHSLCAFEQRLFDEDLTRTSAPICVVGAGLSAADAILMALEAGLPVIHVFRCGPSDPSLIFRKLPQSIYPEYHRVAMLMKGQVTDELYQPYPRHRVVEISHEMVLLKPCLSRPNPSRSPSPHDNDPSIVSVDVSLTVIMIGSRPDLSFLPGGGRDLGVVPKWPIDSKHNPIDVDPFSYQSTHEQGLFAMGPLVADNFVRFGIGGALGIANHLSQAAENP
ncbi:oxidative stress-induced growth inhibitor 1-like isoform X2 [Littorina saxatilis]|uniref:oxidative stress-induced growth inhibitor 1-like isoform X2 n=1 Tax=Littorina saxatilis TaxID=31220 RepID=UPI0038B59C8C